MGQASFFTLFSLPADLSQLTQLPYPKSFMLTHELETLGLPLALHLLERYEGILRNVAYVRAYDLNAHVVKEVSGIYTQGKEKSLKK